MVNAQKDFKSAKKQAQKEKERVKQLEKEAEKGIAVGGVKVQGLVAAALSKAQCDQFAKNEQDLVIEKVEELAKVRQEVEAREYVKKNVVHGYTIIAQGITNMKDKYGSKWKPRVNEMIDPKQMWGVWYRLRAELLARYEEIISDANIAEKVVIRAVKDGMWFKGQDMDEEQEDAQIQAVAIALAGYKEKIDSELLKTMDEVGKRFILDKPGAQKAARIFCKNLNETYNRKEKICDIFETSGCNNWKPAQINEVTTVGYEEEQKQQKKGKIGLKRTWETAVQSGNACKFGMKCRIFGSRTWECNDVHPVAPFIWWEKIDIQVRIETDKFIKNWMLNNKGYGRGRGKGQRRGGRGYRGGYKGGYY